MMFVGSTIQILFYELKSLLEKIYYKTGLMKKLFDKSLNILPHTKMFVWSKSF